MTLASVAIEDYELWRLEMGALFLQSGQGAGPLQPGKCEFGTRFVSHAVGPSARNLMDEVYKEKTCQSCACLWTQSELKKLSSRALAVGKVHRLYL